MKKLLAVFAHPDDEAFGPAGFIVKAALEVEVDLVCVTDGNDPNRQEDLTQIRKQELLASAKILGIKSVDFWGYKDGSLSNGVYHELAKKIIKKATETGADTLLTFEHSGVSGHLDHIALSMICTYVFEKSTSLQKLYYFCISKEQRANIDDYFIHFPKGHSRQEVDEVVDVSEVWDKKLKAIQCHVSQKDDVESVLEEIRSLPKQEYFFLRKKLEEE